MQGAETLGYRQDEKGFFRVIDGDRFRPLDVVDQKLTIPNLSLMRKREKNREMVAHGENWQLKLGNKSLWGSLFSGR